MSVQHDKNMGKLEKLADVLQSRVGFLEAEVLSKPGEEAFVALQAENKKHIAATNGLREQVCLARKTTHMVRFYWTDSCLLVSRRHLVRSVLVKKMRNALQKCGRGRVREETSFFAYIIIL